MAAPGKLTTTTGIDPPVATPAVQVYFPPAYGTPHVVITNSGASGCYLGGSSVTVGTGMYFPPGAQLTFPFAPFPIFSCDGGLQPGTVPTSTVTIAAAAGGTVLAVSSTASTAAGVLLQVGNSVNSQETVLISTVPNAGSVTTTTPLQFDHVAGGTVTIIASQAATSLSVNVGVT